MRYCAFIIILATLACNSENMNQASTGIDKKVDSLMNLMTLEEKVGQLNMYNGTWEFTGPVPADDNSKVKAENIKKGLVGGMLNVLTAKGTLEAQKLAVENSRLGIPLMFGYDMIHGYKTMFPIPLAQAASWDPEVGKVSSGIGAKEMAAAGLHWAFGPMIDVAPDARWGRIMEGAGEDPFLTSVFAKAWVEGLQGDDLSDINTVAACVKHFAAYGFAEAGMDYFSVDVSDQTLHNVALPPFKAAVESGAAAIMNSFNDLNGIPATAHKYLQRDILKGKWGFDGIVLSDWASINELVTHGYSKDGSEAAMHALTAGCDMDMESKVYEKHLPDLIKSGVVEESLLDDAIERILKVKFKLGLFDDPYKYSNEQREKESLLSQEHLDLARKTGRESVVLLKNENNLLPLKKSGLKIAVIGQLADNKDVVLGSWRAQATPYSGVTILEGVKNSVESNSQVSYSKGYTLIKGERDFKYELDVVEGDLSGFPAAVELAKNSDVVILVIGEDCFQSGEGRSQTDIGLKGNQEELIDEIIKVNKNVVGVLLNGRPLAIPNVAQKIPSIVEGWYLGSEMGNSIADVIFGDYNPSGKLPVSFPHSTGQEPFYYYKKNSGRPVQNEFDAGMVFWSHYTDSPKSAVFPFGHGLSYSSFEYENLDYSLIEGGVNLKVTVKNLSEIDGVETVQVYIRDLAASETQPAKKLVAYEKVLIESGSEKIIEFELGTNELGFYLSNGEFIAENGEFIFFVGGSSEETMNVKLDVTF